MKEEHRLIKNTGLIAIGNLSTKLVSFFLLPLYTALLTTSEYGTVDYIISISTFCVPFATMLMDESMFRYLIDAKNDAERRSIISVAIKVTGGGILIVTCICGLIYLFTKKNIVLVFLMYMVSSVITTLFSAFLRGIGRTDWYALYNCVTGILNVLLNVTLIAVFRLGVYGMLFAFILAQTSVALFTALKIKVWRFIDFKIAGNYREMLRYSIPMIPNSISWSIINLSDRIVIMNVLGAGFSGLYAVAYKFPTLMDTVYGFFYQSWKESSARALAQGNSNEFFQKIFVHLINFLFAIVILMTAFMPIIFRIVINHRYYEGIYCVPILLYATFFSNLSGFFGGVFTAHKNTWILGTTTIWSAIINLGLNIVLIKALGIYAAALATLLSSIFIYWYRRIKVKSMVKLSYPKTSLIGNIVVSLVILGLFLVQNVPAIISSCMIAVVYAILLNRRMIKMVIDEFKLRF
ncbi:lipopolysaccharide biosynthesis protein [Levilactobacillus namurensis]|uniref:lipopolysaccharide biosynthesis protein n=1 Tax=Levilactobacillus namurensis TaxID=380393 RepID=UPI001E00C6CA|nr:oligosaccharide flippase family protein [Levilactobacillus namurensis]HJE45714.1 oligosaccharide flippase family protein [Levilactobacillus namurensis]